MAHIGAKDQEHLRSTFANLDRKVKILLFSKKGSKLVVPGNEPCQYCDLTEEILKELVALTDNLELEVFTDREAPEFDTYDIDKVPAIVLVPEGEEASGLRFFGIPAGYEFGTLVEDIVDVSKGETSLSAQTKQALTAIADPVHIQVFVTPT